MGVSSRAAIHALASALVFAKPYLTCSGRTPACTKRLLPTCTWEEDQSSYCKGDIVPLCFYPQGTAPLRVRWDARRRSGIADEMGYPAILWLEQDGEVAHTDQEDVEQSCRSAYMEQISRSPPRQHSGTCLENVRLSTLFMYFSVLLHTSNSLSQVRRDWKINGEDNFHVCNVQKMLTYNHSIHL